MKLKVSKKQINRKNETVLKVGYCDLQNLLYCKNPFAYSSGVNGWSCDYYDLGSTIISTGYNATGQTIDYNIIDRYEKEAEKLKKENTSFLELEKKLDILIKKFVEEVKK